MEYEKADNTDMEELGRRLSSGNLFGDVPLETSPATGTEMTEVAVVVKPVEPTEAVPTKTALSKPTAVEMPLAAKDVFEVHPE